MRTFCPVFGSGFWDDATPANIRITSDSPKNTFYHKASDSYFTMLWRDGKYYQRRHQIDPGGGEINVMEKQIDFIMGSGNHARVYLHRTERHTLVELPLGWYAEKGGYWAMNPGYDRPDYPGSTRLIGYECMSCHNAYPRIPAGHKEWGAEAKYVEPIPEGIDCQRCHGPGQQHVASARAEELHQQTLRHNEQLHQARLKQASRPPAKSGGGKG